MCFGRLSSSTGVVVVSITKQLQQFARKVVVNGKKRVKGLVSRDSELVTLRAIH